MMLMPLKQKPKHNSSDDESSQRDVEVGQTRSQADMIAADDDDEENFVDSLHRKLRILIVDDAISNRKITCKIIQNEVHSSHEIFEADDGDVAVQMVKQSMDEGRPFDLMITDYYMNRMHGSEAVRKLRDEIGFRGIIIGLTGNAFDNTFMDAGCNHVIMKPLRKQQLLDIMITSGLI
jgi:CheY-like chemotaxis protein